MLVVSISPNRLMFCLGLSHRPLGYSVASELLVPEPEQVSGFLRLIWLDPAKALCNFTF
jgi:hypothetical protein